MKPPPKNMPPKSLLFIFLVFYTQKINSIEQNDQTSQTEDQIVSLLERHESQLNRLETLIESLSKQISHLEKPQPSTSAPQPFLQTSLQKPLFPAKLAFLASVHLPSDPTCAAALPYTTAYFAIGNPRGITYIISITGDVILEIPAVSESPVTAILSYMSASKNNESLIYTGHGDGSVAAHRVMESDGGGRWSALGLIESRPFVRGSRDLDSPPVVALELHQTRRVRYVVAADGGGRVRVFTEGSGTLYGTAIASGKVLAFMKQRLLFLTETGAGSLDLRSMMVKETECEGLNGSLAKTYVFDGLEKTKAYGFTSEGDLIHVVLLGEAGSLKCRVRSIRKSEIDSEPVSIQAIRGYILATTLDKVYVYNISSQYYGRVGAPRPVFFSTFQELKSMLLNADHVSNVPALLASNPLIATDGEKLVVLGLGGGHIGIYKSNFPIFKSETNSVFWSVPVLLFLLFLIGIWQFYVKKKDSLGWTSDESFNTSSSVPSGNSLLAAGSTERAYGDVSRTGDIREMRGGGLRGPPRRYVSPPSRYPPRSAISFTSAATSDAAFRGPTDLKYRGSTLETPPGFPPRREPLFPNTQVADEHIE